MADPVIPFTQANLTALGAAMASGATRVSYGDKSVEYRSLSDMRELYAMMLASLTGKTRRRQIQVDCPPDRGL